MEIGVKVDARSYDGATRRHILSAYMTFVAVDANGNPCPVPPLQPETEIDRFRYEEAQLRRELRLSHAEALKKLRGGRDRPTVLPTER